MRNVSYKNADSTRKCNSPSAEERQAASASAPFKPASMRGTDERLPQLTQEESYQIEALLKAGHPQSGIATVLKRDKPTISREVRRNCGLRGYRPKQAQRLALARREARAKRGLTPVPGNGLRACCASSGVRSSSGLTVGGPQGGCVSCEWIEQFC